MQEDESISYCADVLSTLGCTRNSEQLSLFVNLLAIAISRGKSSDQLNVIGSFISGVGGLVSTIAAQKEFCEDKQDKLAQIKDLKKQLKELEESLQG